MKAPDFEAHQDGCLAICAFCSEELPTSEISAHHDSCSCFIISCTHASHGCSWHGARSSVSSHISVCAYEAIKGFFAVHNSKMESLAEENLLLRIKVDTLEGVLQTMKVELQAAKTALGPWYRPDGIESTPISSELPSRLQPSSASTSQHPESNFDPISPLADSFSPYFPLEQTSSQINRHVEHQPSLRAAHRTSSSISQGWDPMIFPLGASLRPATQNNIAPLNLSTPLEGTLSGLRESLISLGASVDSLGRRNDIALTNETLRINEELMSL